MTLIEESSRAASTLNTLWNLPQIHPSGKIRVSLSGKNDGPDCGISQHLRELLLKTINVINGHQIKWFIVYAKGGNVITHRE
jgi:hypothetical protein